MCSWNPLTEMIKLYFQRKYKSETLVFSYGNISELHGRHNRRAAHEQRGITSSKCYH